MVGAVALATALIVAVSCAVASVNAALDRRVATTIGAADARIRHVGRQRFPDDLLPKVRAWSEVRAASPLAEDALPLRRVPQPSDTTPPTDDLVLSAKGLSVNDDPSLRPIPLDRGRRPQSPTEITLSASAAEELAAEIGDTLSVIRFGPRLELTVVGVAEQPVTALFSRPEAWVLRETLDEVTRSPNRIVELSIALNPGVDPVAFAQRRAADLPASLTIEPTERITSGIERSVRSSRIGFLLLSVFAFIAASFIILTGLTTSVLEKQRELAIVRCIGGAPSQIATSQLLIGAIIGALGALGGLPLGVFIAFVASIVFEKQLSAGLHVSALGLAVAAFGSLLAGLAGAAWPAILASRMSPLAGLAARAAQPKPKLIALTGAIGLAFALIQIAAVRIPEDGQVIFWSHATYGAPLMFVGYFLLGAPLVVLIAHTIGPILT
ncbi:MAG: ABC transporter permease, partial [Planctomycetota bacterium]|nr:ABC transporter permease [Planctomycetota bacterium]